MEVHLIDGTYELFRHFFALPRAQDRDGNEVAAVRGVLGSLFGMLQTGVTHIGVATDHVIESFRNDLWPEYKTGAGVDPALLQQFSLLEDAVRVMGIPVWAMEEFEADDALASVAAAAAKTGLVERVVICSPDKDLSQCVTGTRIVQLDRRQRLLRDEAGVVAKFGVLPSSIPDYLGLVGDAADGYPGIRGWGAKSASALLFRYGHIELIPSNPSNWDVRIMNAKGLAEALNQDRDRAFLFRDLATLRSDIPLLKSVEELQWSGVTPSFAPLAERLDGAVTSSGTGNAEEKAARRTPRLRPLGESARQISR